MFRTWWAECTWLYLPCLCPWWASWWWSCSCGNCGGALVQRPDDAPDTVRKRLEVYRAQTEPLIAHYTASATPVYHVDGDRDVPAVQADVRKRIGGP